MTKCWPAIRLAMDIGQRPSDVRSMTWGSYDGTMLKLRQSKTGEWVEVPVLPDLKKCLDMCRRGDNEHLLVNESTGQPYRKELLQERVRTAMRNAGISDDLQLRDLRRTEIVRMAVAGSTNAEIAAITGHSINNTARFLKCIYHAILPWQKTPWKRWENCKSWTKESRVGKTVGTISS